MSHLVGAPLTAMLAFSFHHPRQRDTVAGNLTG